MITLDYNDILHFGKFKDNKITEEFVFENYEYLNWAYEEEIINLSEKLNNDIYILRLNKKMEITEGLYYWESLDYWDILHD